MQGLQPPGVAWLRKPRLRDTPGFSLGVTPCSLSWRTVFHPEAPLPHRLLPVSSSWTQTPGVPLPTERTPPPPPNFRKFGLRLPSPKQVQAQFHLLAPLSAPDLHCSRSRRPPHQEQLLLLRSPACPRPGPPGHAPAPRAVPDTRLGRMGARGRTPSSKRLPRAPQARGPRPTSPAWAARSPARTPRAPVTGLPACSPSRQSTSPGSSSSRPLKLHTTRPCSSRMASAVAIASL